MQNSSRCGASHTADPLDDGAREPVPLSVALDEAIADMTDEQA